MCVCQFIKSIWVHSVNGDWNPSLSSHTSVFPCEAPTPCRYALVVHLRAVNYTPALHSHIPDLHWSDLRIDYPLIRCFRSEKSTQNVVLRSSVTVTLPYRRLVYKPRNVTMMDDGADGGSFFLSLRSFTGATKALPCVATCRVRSWSATGRTLGRHSSALISPLSTCSVSTALNRWVCEKYRLTVMFINIIKVYFCKVRMRGKSVYEEEH